MTIKLLIMSKITDKNTDITLEDPEIIRSAAISKALGHPARIAILKILAQQKTCFCGDITGIIPLAQSTVSQNLKVLKTDGLIIVNVEGLYTLYCMYPVGVK